MESFIQGSALGFAALCRGTGFAVGAECEGDTELHAGSPGGEGKDGLEWGTGNYGTGEVADV